MQEGRASSHLMLQSRNDLAKGILWKLRQLMFYYETENVMSIILNKLKTVSKLEKLAFIDIFSNLLLKTPVGLIERN